MSKWRGTLNRGMNAAPVLTLRYCVTGNANSTPIPVVPRVRPTSRWFRIRRSAGFVASESLDDAITLPIPSAIVAIVVVSRVILFIYRLMF